MLLRTVQQRPATIAVPAHPPTGTPRVSAAAFQIDKTNIGSDQVRAIFLQVRKQESRCATIHEPLTSLRLRCSP
jgi:hypothetical protein